ncbi:MAG: hypothetical protein AB7R89_00510 [Dehalococcoidia bacterium]
MLSSWAGCPNERGYRGRCVPITTGPTQSRLAQALVVPAPTTGGVTFSRWSGEAAVEEVTVTPVFSLTVPANADAGTYTGTITVTVTPHP